MKKYLILILALALVAGISFAAYAEVQNVKVSGDITVKGVARNNLDLAKTPVGSVPNTILPPGSATRINSNTYDDKQSDLLSITRVRVDADLTDNVMATVRLLNERNWNGESMTGSNTNVNVGPTNPGGAAGTNVVDEQNIDVDLAYVHLKEFLYSPLSLTIGRQDLRFGNGWIVGDPDTNGISLRTSLAEGDLSARKSFDAIRATLDYNPLVVDLIYSKVNENDSRVNDDLTLAGVNAAYELSKSTTLEGFFFSKMRGSNAAPATTLDNGLTTNFMNTAALTSTNKQSADVVNTVGARVVNKSVKNLIIDGQAAYQFGTYNPKFDPNARYFVHPNGSISKAEVSPRNAWGLEIGATYMLKDMLTRIKSLDKLAKYDPTLSAMYIYLSGEDRDKTGDKMYKGWDPMFEDQTAGHLINAIFGFSNVHLVGLTGTAKPKEDISMKLDWVLANFAKRYPEGRLAILSGVSGARQFRMGKTSYMGQEIDATMTYDYTEDVQFSLLGGIFLPGKSINEGVNNGLNADSASGNRAAATELIGSMKVTF